MSGPIVRTGATPAYWDNYDAIFGGDAKKPGEKAAKKSGKKAVKKTTKKAAAKKSQKKAVKKKSAKKK